MPKKATAKPKKEKSTSTKATTKDKAPKKLTPAQRLDQLEEQVRNIFKKIDNLELMVIGKTSLTQSIQPNEEIKKIILHLGPSGKSISLDELSEFSSLQDFGWDSIQATINSMVDKELIDVSEGISKLKIDNKYGRIIIR